MVKKQKRRLQEVLKGESKSDKFIRVVTPRVNKAIKAISVIGYCAGSAYEYTPEEVAQILDAINEATLALKNKFSKRSSEQKEFRFLG